MSDIRDASNVFAPRELLQIAMLATAALNEAHNEGPSDFAQLAESLEFWPILFNEKVDLTAYRSLRIGYQLFDSKNPKKRVGDGPLVFFAKVVVVRLETLRLSALLRPLGLQGEEFAMRFARESHEKVFAAVSGNFGTKNLAEYQRTIADYVPDWADSLESLEEFSGKSAEQWRKAGERLFKGAFKRPEKIPELVLSPEGDAHELESVKRARLVARLGRAIKSIAAGLDEGL